MRTGIVLGQNIGRQTSLRDRPLEEILLFSNFAVAASCPATGHRLARTHAGEACGSCSSHVRTADADICGPRSAESGIKAACRDQSLRLGLR